MAKRANGEGNIHKRKDGRYQISFPTGIYKDNGKREVIYKYAATQACHQKSCKSFVQKGI